jgi:glutamine cyclotransferase
MEVPVSNKPHPPVAAGQKPGTDAAVSRRRFLLGFGGAAVIAGGAAIGATWLLTRGETSEQLKARARESNIPIYGIEVVKSYPHDDEAFTQGLLFHNGELYESTGLEGRSTVRRVALATGKVLDSTRLAPELFGEGMALVGDELIVVTYKHRLALRYDRATLRLKDELKDAYEGEGWGLTYNGKHLILSNGSSTLQFLDPKTFRTQRLVEVKLADSAVKKLNELEFIEGEVWANIWQEDTICRIDPQSGRVTGWIDLGKLWPGSERTATADVLNGIAYDARDKRIFVTGKCWPKLYEIKLVKS